MSFNPDKINIHELAIEEPEKRAELPFDPERDVKEEDWQGILEYIKDRALQRDVASCASSLALINPELAADAGAVNLDKIRGALEKSKEDKDGELITRLAAAIKTLNPSEELNLDEGYWKEVEKELNYFKTERDWGVFCDFAVDAKIIFPEKEIPISEEEWKGILSTAKGYREYRYAGHVESFAGIAASVKILCPSKKISMEPEDWRHMKDALKATRGKDWATFVEAAREMQIIGSDHAEITSGGLHLIMPNIISLENQTPELPENKQF